MKIALVLLALCFSAPLFAQQSLPVGTVLPVKLNSSLSLKTKPGQVITARVMQTVPAAPGFKIPAGSKLLGHVLEVVPAASGSAAKITLSFDTLNASHRSIQIVTDLRAIASLVEVGEAQIPDSGPDRGTAEAVYTTNQVGGEVVYRGGGPVADGLKVVGKPVPGGVLGRLRPNDSGDCRGAIDGNDRPQALWIFSTDACGVYGLSGLEIAHAGRTEPLGRIVFTSNSNDLKIPGGSGMLLRVISVSGSSAACLPGNQSLAATRPA